MNRRVHLRVVANNSASDTSDVAAIKRDYAAFANRMGDSLSLFARIRRLIAVLTVMYSLPYRIVVGGVLLCYRFSVGLHWFVYRAQYAVFGMAIFGALFYCFWRLFLLFQHHHT